MQTVSEYFENSSTFQKLPWNETPKCSLPLTSLFSQEIARKSPQVKTLVLEGGLYFRYQIKALHFERLSG
jgi:hypothetical protein